MQPTISLVIPVQLFYVIRLFGNMDITITSLQQFEEETFYRELVQSQSPSRTA
jgi:hypothetical protein